jgi:CRISPR-associated protein Csm2
LLKPKLAYARARATGNESKEALASFEKVLGAGIDAIFRGTKESEFKRFKNFASFFEAILAYHRAEGGK